MLLKLIALVAATAAVSMTLSKSALFAPIRQSLSESASRPMVFLGRLLECPYCTSHWVALYLVGMTNIRFVHGWPVVDLFVTTMAVVALAAIPSAAIYHGYKSMGSHE